MPDGLPSMDEVKLAMKRMSKSSRPTNVSVWGTAYSLLFWRGQQESEEERMSLDHAFAFASSPNTLWCFVHKYEKSLGVVIRMDVQGDGRALVSLPLTTLTVLDLFCDQYDAVSTLQYVGVRKVFLDWPAQGPPSVRPKLASSSSSSAPAPLADQYVFDLLFRLSPFIPESARSESAARHSKPTVAPAPATSATTAASPESIEEASRRCGRAPLLTQRLCRSGVCIVVPLPKTFGRFRAVIRFRFGCSVCQALSTLLGVLLLRADW